MRIIRLSSIVLVAWASGLVVSSWTTAASSEDPAPGSTADFKVAQKVKPHPAAVAGSVTFTITVTNMGPATKRATLIDSVTRPDIAGTHDKGPTPSRGSCTAFDTASTFTCALGKISAGQQAKVVFTRSYCGPAGRILTNHATVLSALDPQPANNTSRLQDHTVSSGIGCG